MGYVYRYTHPETRKYYVGSTNGNNPRYSGSGLIWENAKSKYGIKSFVKEILYEGPDYREEEKRILRELDAANDPLSYNMKNEALGGTFHGEQNGMYGKTHTEETKLKMSLAHKGIKKPEGFGEKIRKAQLGKPLTKERKKNISLAKTGIPISKSHREKIREAHKRKFYNHVSEIVECPHCGKAGGLGPMKRWHFDNCKDK